MVGHIPVDNHIELEHFLVEDYILVVFEQFLVEDYILVVFEHFLVEGDIPAVFEYFLAEGDILVERYNLVVDFDKVLFFHLDNY